VNAAKSRVSARTDPTKTMVTLLELLEIIDEHSDLTRLYGHRTHLPARLDHGLHTRPVADQHRHRPRRQRQGKRRVRERSGGVQSASKFDTNRLGGRLWKLTEVSRLIANGWVAKMQFHSGMTNRRMDYKRQVDLNR